MPKTVEYTGTQRRWPELAVTGKQSVWFPGQAEERSDTEAALLLATGLFKVPDDTLTPAEVAAVKAMVSVDGMPDVQSSVTLCGVLGDSMAMQNHRAVSGASAITSIVRSGGFVTMTFSSAHNLLPNNKVRLVNLGTFNGRFVLSGAPSTTTATFAQAGVDESATITSNSAVVNESVMFATGFLTWLSMLTGGALRLVDGGNQGVGGERTDQILARVAAAVSSTAMRWFVGPVGYNDIGQTNPATGATYTPADTAANIVAIVRALVAGGKVVHAGSMIPMATNAPKWSAANSAYITRVNRLLKTALAGMRGVTFSDLYTPLVNASDGTNVGVAAANMLSPTDGVHPDVAGAYRIAKAYMLQLGTIHAAANLLPSSPADSKTALDASSPNILANGPWSGTGGTASTGVTGTVATGFTASRNTGTGTAVASIVTGPDGCPRQRLALTTAGAEEWLVRTNDGATQITRLVAGRRYRFGFATEVSDMAGGNVRSVYGAYQLTIGGTTYTIDVVGYSSTVQNATTDTASAFVLMSDEFVLPSGSLTNATLYAYLRTSAAGAVINWDVGRFFVVDLDAA